MGAQEPSVHENPSAQSAAWRQYDPWPPGSQTPSMQLFDKHASFAWQALPEPPAEPGAQTPST